MSILLMSRVWTYALDHPEQSILLALTDHADDFGGSVFPSVGYVAWKTGYSARQVQRIMGDLRARGVLIQVRAATRDRPVEYRIDLARLEAKEPYRATENRGDNMSSLSSAGVTQPRHPRGDTERGRGDISGERGDIAMAPEPSPEPPKEPSSESPPGPAQCDECLRIVRPDGFGHMQVCRDYRVPPTSPRFRARAATSGADAAAPQGVAHGPAAA